MTIPLRFDESNLLEELEKLPKIDRSIFATSCAGRLTQTYSTFSMRTGKGDPDILRKTVDRVWDALAGLPIIASEFDELIETCTRLMPSEDDGSWVMEQAAAEDAVSSLVYSLRCYRSGLSREAAWAARRAYEALDDYVTNAERIDTNEMSGETRVVTHPLVQAELARQSRDLNILLKGQADVRELQRRSNIEAAIFLP